MKRERRWFVSFILVFTLGMFVGIFLIGCGDEEKSAQGINSQKTLQEEKSVEESNNKCSIASSNLTRADSVGLRKVSWSIASTKDDYIVPCLIDILEDDNGWSRAELDFEYSAEARSDFHIVFQTYSREMYSSPTDPNNPCYYIILDGCARVELIGEELQCTVSIWDEYFTQSVLHFFLGLTHSEAINHEVGHCFGFTHSENMDDVMFPFANRAKSSTPNSREIEALAGMLESREVYTAIENLHGISISEKVKNKYVVSANPESAATP